MTSTMLRGHSGRLALGRHLFPSAASAKPYLLGSIATHSSGAAWKPLQRISFAATSVSSPILRGRSNAASAASLACSRAQFGTRESRNSTFSSLAFKDGGVFPLGYGKAESGGGNGSGIGKGNSGGGGGGSGGSGGGSGSSGAGEGGIRRLWTWYLGLLDTNPILTKAVTSAVLTFIGDTFCQFYLEKAESLDGKRVAVMTFLGFGLVGPSLHFWYSTLNKLVTARGAAGVGIRLVLDQFVFSPSFIALFISCLISLEQSPSQVTAKLKQDWASTVVANWQLWIPTQIINFWLVPLKLQVGFANFISLFWNAYLSWKTHLKVATPQSLTSEYKPS